MMRGDKMKIITQFKQHSQNMMFTLGRGLYQSMAMGATTPAERDIARKQTAAILAIHIASSGIITY